jgi:hypothetical protein
MKALYYITSFCLLALIGCKSDFPEAATEIGNVEGSYRTNGLLDVSCVAISDENQLPTLTVTKESGNTYRLVRTDFIPGKRTTEMGGIRIETKPDTLLLFKGNTRVGHLRLGTVRLIKGKKTKEIQAPLLLVTVDDTLTKTFLFYYGYRQ